MDRLRKKLAQNALRFVAAAVVFMLTPRDWLRNMAAYVRWIILSGIGLDRVLRSRTVPLLLFVLFFLLMLVGLVSAIRCLTLMGRMARLTAQSGREGRYTDARGERAAVSERADAGDKYLAQLDDYLKNGIIDRAEYDLMRERYERMRGDRR